MEYKSYNYTTLEEELKTHEDSIKVSEVTNHPRVLIERSNVLLWDFIEEYIHNPQKLLLDIDLRKDVITAKIYSIYEQMCLAEKMIVECNDYCQTFNTALTDTTKRGDVL